MKCFPLLSLVAFLFLISLTQASGSFFDRTTLNVEGKVVRVAVEDLNDDDLLDILAVYITGHCPEQKRWLAVFWQEEAHTFGTTPSQIWEVDPRAAVLDVGDVVSGSGQEILFMAEDGVYTYGQSNGIYLTDSRKLFETATLFALAEDDDLPIWNFARDICPDAGSEILVSRFGGIELWCKKENGTYQLKQTFPVKTTVDVYAERPGENYPYSLRADYRSPRVETKDFNSDGRTDIIICWEDNLDVFLQEQKGMFHSRPDHQLRMALRTDDEIKDDEVDLLLSIDDINGDGQTDIVANKMKGGLANATTQTSLFLGQVGGRFDETPNHFIAADDAVSEPYLVDLDGDKRLDLIQPEVKMGIKSVVSMLLMKKFNINFLVYLNRGDDLFSDEPDYSTKIGFEIDFTRRGGQASPLIEFEGDYNGDGRKDLAVGTTENEVSIFFGDKRKVFTKNPQVRESVKTTYYVVAKDFDGDGKTELLLFYSDDDELNNKIIVLHSK